MTRTNSAKRAVDAVARFNPAFQEANASVARYRVLKGGAGSGKSANVDGVVLKLDGEDAPSGKAYRRLASYTPGEGDRVYVVKAGAELLVIGKVV